MAKRKYNLHLKGYVGGWDFDSDYVDYVLQKQDGKPVNVLIDSLGGSVATALSISSAFRNHGDVSVHYVGMNASAATIASLGAKYISIDASAMYLVHKCSNYVFKYGQLNADELQQLIDECEKQKKDLEKIDLNIASMYAGRCKKEKDALLELMKDGAWLTAKEALEWGFVDEVTDDPEDVAPVMDDATANALASAGIPIPNIGRGEPEGFLTKLLAALSSLFSANNSSTKIVTAMNKTFKFICALLQVEAFASNDGKITLTEDQMQSVEDRIAALEQQNLDLQNQITSKDAQIENLRKKPADDSSSIVDDGNDKTDLTAQTYVDALNNAREMFNSIP